MNQWTKKCVCWGNSTKHQNIISICQSLLGLKWKEMVGSGKAPRFTARFLDRKKIQDSWRWTFRTQALEGATARSSKKKTSIWQVGEMLLWGRVFIFGKVSLDIDTSRSQPLLPVVPLLISFFGKKARHSPNSFAHRNGHHSVFLAENEKKQWKC